MTMRIREAVLAAAAALSVAGAADAQPTDGRPDATSVVLVHGAFADGSGWRGSADRL